MKTTLIKKAKKELSSKEYSIFKMIYPKSGVLFLKGKPGIGKTAILRTIAEKLELQYIDLRLSQMDETDIGVFPTIDTIDGNRVVEHALPKWAILANQKPTLIHFEELNRAALSVRNAALQILNERAVGYNFKFNEDVYMVSTGNIGEEDGNDVEEFDSALKTRLIVKNYDLSLAEWITNFAKDKVNKYIIKYLEGKPTDFYKFNTDSGTYATPRGWTFLSDYINAVCNDPNNINEIYENVSDIADCYVGPSAIPFVKFLESSSLVNIKDILNRYSSVKDDVERLGIAKKSELMMELKEIKLNTINKTQTKNVIDFLASIEEDQRISFILSIIDNYDKEIIKSNESIKEILTAYKNLLKIIKKD